MPTYEYKREDGTTFEIFQGINDEPLKKCPDTGQKVKRIISGGGGVVYKGEGFYITDYKNNGRKNGSDHDAAAGNGGETKTKATDESGTSKTDRD